jgi:hypothetical protein
MTPGLCVIVWLAFVFAWVVLVCYSFGLTFAMLIYWSQSRHQAIYEYTPPTSGAVIATASR